MSSWALHWPDGTDEESKCNRTKTNVEFAGTGLGMLSEAGGVCAAQLPLGQSAFADVISFTLASRSASIWGGG